MFFRKRKEKNNKEIVLKVNTIIGALGETNIKSVSLNNKRLSVLVKDPSSVNISKLKESKLIGTLKGTEIVFLLKENVDKIYKQLLGGLKNE